MSSKDSVLEVTDQSLEPYVGPRPFRREIIDQVRFFGRDAETDEIVSLIASHRLVLVYAQSGAGKTSIFNAQVIPTLEGYSGFEVLPVARVRITMAPSSIISKDFSDNNSDTSSSQIENIFIYSALQTLRRDIDPISLKNLSLFEFLDDYFPNSKDEDGDLRPQVLIFDQLEELFSFPDIEQQKGFFEQIGDSLENNPLLKIVFIIREDYLAQLDPFKSKLPEKLRPSFRLERLRRNEAILAIKGPLTKFLNKDEVKNIQDKIKELVSDLLKTYIEIPGDGSIQIEGEYIEPIYLQIVCRRWWHESSASKGSDNRMEISKDLANVDKALQDFYEHAVHSAAKQTGVHESRIRNWCQHKLMTSSGTRGMIHQEHKSTAGLNNKAISILEKNYLVRAEIRLGAKWYELAHDRMIEPIKNSNKTWRKKEIKKSLVKKVIIPVVVVIIIGALFAYNAYNQSLNTYNLSIYHLETITTNQIALINSLDQAASALYDSGQYQKAITYYDKILDIDPKYPPSLNGKAKALISLGLYNEALTYLSKALEIEPSNEAALANKGIALNSRGDELYNEGKYQEAITYYNKALAIDPKNAGSLNGKAKALISLGQYNKALTYLSEALEIEPSYEDALANKGIALVNIGHHSEALKSIDAALAIDPNDTYALNAKGNAFDGLGNYKEAITYYDKALAIDPNFVYA
ncbi:MAG TPA: tetratricopeptide repeat protein, partial [Nitrososphaeraceae archaeon]|nr:tetratricopeptide repeat protein [Nitrososphaeraceae archaeon]